MSQCYQHTVTFRSIIINFFFLLFETTASKWHSVCMWHLTGIPWKMKTQIVTTMMIFSVLSVNTPTNVFCIETLKLVWGLCFFHCFLNFFQFERLGCSKPRIRIPTSLVYASGKNILSTFLFPVHTTLIPNCNIMCFCFFFLISPQLPVSCIKIICCGLI